LRDAASAVNANTAVRPMNIERSAAVMLAKIGGGRNTAAAMPTSTTNHRADGATEIEVARPQVHET